MIKNTHQHNTMHALSILKHLPVTYYAFIMLAYLTQAK